MIHTGIGYDVHRLAPGHQLIIGGVELAHDLGLVGHSDADVLMHAICDAVLGALGEGDIGSFFPDTDPKWKDAASRLFLKEAAARVLTRRGTLIHVDATIIAEKPKIQPYIPAMKTNLAEALSATPEKFGIKATTHERIGCLGRGEGIAAMAVANVDLPC